MISANDEVKGGEGRGEERGCCDLTELREETKLDRVWPAVNWFAGADAGF